MLMCAVLSVIACTGRMYATYIGDRGQGPNKVLHFQQLLLTPDFLIGGLVLCIVASLFADLLLFVAHRFIFALVDSKVAGKASGGHLRVQQHGHLHCTLAECM